MIAGAHQTETIPADTTMTTFRQPDGSVFRTRAFGDEFLNGHETAAGYTILRNARTGFWIYARHGPGGSLIPGRTRTGAQPPASLAHHLRNVHAVRTAVRERAAETHKEAAIRRSLVRHGRITPNSKVQRSLVI